MVAQMRLGARRATLHYVTAFRYSRQISTDGRQRLSAFWAPTGLVNEAETDRHDPNAPKDNSAQLLVKAGYMRQSHSGIFHLLPLGLRVQSKLESLIDKHMSSIAASKLSLSSISTETLWKQSGRYDPNSTTELLRIKDRRSSGFLLAPTHEEEITSLVASSVKSYKDLPVRLYQIGRKYRDEKRPRGGLLRAKEFVMKDLYTFDHTVEQAMRTYEEVRAAYKNLFDELGVPYTIAEADSGNIGGKLSHEYHFIHPSGEDKVWSCGNGECGYTANEELVAHRTEVSVEEKDKDAVVFRGISKDGKTEIRMHVPRSEMEDHNPLDWTTHINPFAVARAADELGVELATGLEPATLSSLLSKAHSSIDIYDIRLSSSSSPPTTDTSSTPTTASPTPTSTSNHDILPIRPSDFCPRCSTGHLHPAPGIEIAHTFHLGTRYSAPLNCTVATPDNKAPVPVQMGCHGIGVSRLIAACAAVLAHSPISTSQAKNDKLAKNNPPPQPTGINLPIAITPFHALLVSAPGIPSDDVSTVYDTLSTLGIDTVIDDRGDKSLGWKLKDADLIGYPVVVVLGKAWKSGTVGHREEEWREGEDWVGKEAGVGEAKSERKVEVQCRRLGIRGLLVGEGDVGGRLREILGKL